MTTYKHRSFRPMIRRVVLPCFAALLVPLQAASGAEQSGFAPVVIEKVSVARQLSLLRAICEPGQVAMRDGVPVCSRCPSYTTGDTGGLRIVNVIESDFTRPAAGEALVDIAGCEPVARNQGGSVLLEADKQDWRRILYQAGFRSNECVRFRTMRQTISLACNTSSTHQGIQRGELAWFSLHGGSLNRQPLLAWYDNSQSNPRRLISIFPHRFMKSDFNSDGRVDLQVTVRVRDATVPEQYPGFLDAMVAGHRFDKAKSLRLIFLSDGNSLVLSPISEADKLKIDSLIRHIDER